MIRKIVIITLTILVLIAGALVVAGQFNLLGGQRPTDLGIRNNQLKAPDATKQNSVSSQAALHPHTGYHVIAPITFAGDGKAAFGKLTRIVREMEGATIIDAQSNYLYVEYRTKWLKFMDDAEFFIDEKAGVIHMRSASRLGSKDMGVNRKRLETIREQFSR